MSTSFQPLKPARLQAPTETDDGENLTRHLVSLYNDIADIGEKPADTENLNALFDVCDQAKDALHTFKEGFEGRRLTKKEEYPGGVRDRGPEAVKDEFEAAEGVANALNHTGRWFWLYSFGVIDIIGRTDPQKDIFKCEEDGSKRMMKTFAALQNKGWWEY